MTIFNLRVITIPNLSLVTYTRYDMKKVNIRKRFILTIFLTIILILLFAPLFSDNLIAGMWLSSFHNKAARVDIQNTADENVAVKVTEVQSPSWHNVEYQKRRKNTAVINGTISSKWRKFTVEFEAVNDGDITILWRGPYFVFNAKQYPVLVDFRLMEVNGKQIFKDRKTCKFDNPLKYVITVKKGEVVKLSFEARKHHWHFSDLRRFYSMNWLLFFSVIILAFLLSYKSIQYVSKFKIMEHNSRIDIVFVVAFVVLLFVPMSHISTVTRSVQENRMLAKYPSLLDKTLNLNYGKQFEKWFNDRFRGRDFLQNIYFDIKMKVNAIYQNSRAILLKKSNWMYNQRILAKLPKKPDEIVKSLKEFNEFLRRENINFYILIVPSKHSVYYELLQKDYGYNTETQKELDQWIENLKQSGDLKVVYPYKELRQARSKDFVFFKQTHHWTDWGAYIGYKALMKTLTVDYPDLHIGRLNEYERLTSKLIREDSNRKFGCGQTTRLLKIGKEYALKYLLKDDYVYYDHKNVITPKIIDVPYIKSKYYKNKNQKNAPRAMVIGTSQNENLMQFLPYSFSELKFYRINNTKKVSKEEEFKILKRFRSAIKDYKPDILILSVTVKNFNHGMNKIMED